MKKLVLIILPMMSNADGAQAQSVNIIEASQTIEGPILSVATSDLRQQNDVSIDRSRAIGPVVNTIVADPFDEGENPDLSRKRRNAVRWEIGYQVLNLVDAVQTADCVKRGVCEEANPIFRYTIGKRPSPIAMIGAKALFGAAHWIMFNELNRTDPDRATKMARWSFGMQGGMIMFNTRIAF